MTEPLVTVVIAARNEESDIEGCIRAIGDQDLPLDRLAVVVVDGASDDRTNALALDSLGRFAFGRTSVLSNPVGTTPSNLNLALADATGPLICRVDARSTIPTDYVRRCVEELASHPGRSVVGGSQRARAGGPDPTQVGIARALNNRWALGNSKYRRGGPSGPADTVYLGAFRTADLRSVGGWNERMATNQDFDLNRRMAALGQVWFIADLVVEYRPRADHRSLFLQYLRFGSWKVRYWRQSGDRPQPRQLLGLASLPIGLAGALVVLSGSGRRRMLAVVLGGVTVAAVEHRGSSGPAGGPADRLSAVAAMVSIWGGWTLGAWAAILGRRPQVDRR